MQSMSQPSSEADVCQLPHPRPTPPRPPRCPSVIMLYLVVDHCQWHQEEGDPRQAVADNSKRSQQTKHLGKEDVELERQRVINGEL